MHSFDRDISLSRSGHGNYTISVSDNWSVNHNPNGGYLMAMLAQAMLGDSQKKLPVILTANYIKRGLAGAADIAVRPIADSTRFNRIQAQLIQEGVPRVHAIGTFTDDTSNNAEEEYESPPPVIARLEDCVPVDPMPDYSIYDGVDVRLDPECAEWFLGKLSEKSELKGWIRFRDERPHDLYSILLMADAFPPPVLASHGLVAWVPTLELSVNFRNLPTSSWLQGIFRTRFISGGILEEDGELWDENGKLVALCRQIAQYRKLT